MKNPIVFLFLLTLFAAPCRLLAQSEKSYTPLQLTFTLGYAMPNGPGVKGGIALHLEPQFHLTNNFSLGLRVGAAGLVKSTLDASDKPVGDGSLAAVASYLLTGNLYFQPFGAAFRPFVGIGLGYADAAGASTSTTSQPTTTTTVSSGVNRASGIAGLVRAGFDVGHFRLNAEYALNPKTGRVPSSYLGLNIGCYLGGGSRK